MLFHHADSPFAEVDRGAFCGLQKGVFILFVKRNMLAGRSVDDVTIYWENYSVQIAPEAWAVLLVS